MPISLFPFLSPNTHKGFSISRRVLKCVQLTLNECQNCQNSLALLAWKDLRTTAISASRLVTNSGQIKRVTHSRICDLFFRGMRLLVTAENDFLGPPIQFCVNLLLAKRVYFYIFPCPFYVKTWLNWIRRLIICIKFPSKICVVIQRIAKYLLVRFVAPRKKKIRACAIAAMRLRGGRITRLRRGSFACGHELRPALGHDGKARTVACQIFKTMESSSFLKNGQYFEQILKVVKIKLFL